MRGVRVCTTVLVYTAGHTGEGQRAALWIWFWSVLTWVQGIKLSLSGLPSKHASPMSHLAGSKTEEFTVRLNKLTLGPAPMLCLMSLLLLSFFPPKRLINKLIIVRTIFVCIIPNNLRILAFWSEKKKKPNILEWMSPIASCSLSLGEPCSWVKCEMI